MRARQYKVQQYNDARFSSITCCTSLKLKHQIKKELERTRAGLNLILNVAKVKHGSLRNMHGVLKSRYALRAQIKHT